MPDRDHQELIGVGIAAMVAAIGLAGILLIDLQPSANSDADITTASVLSRAGATSAPSQRPVNLTIPESVLAIR